MKEIKKYIEEYNYFLKETGSQEIAIGLMKEKGLDHRTELINLANKEMQKQKEQEPASEKQIKFIKDLQKQGKIPADFVIPEKFTKGEATVLIQETINKNGTK